MQKTSEQEKKKKKGPKVTGKVILYEFSYQGNFGMGTEPASKKIFFPVVKKMYGWNCAYI